MITLRKVSAYGPKVKKKKKKKENNHFMEKNPFGISPGLFLESKLSSISYFNCDNQACNLLLEV